ncbi:MAG TPA: hypothetical protein VFE24_09265 [Pirellulales bacterium]|jgi:hypothetical protein|nr:hypothetical protein [Pirellulales bacterium]
MISPIDRRLASLLHFQQIENLRRIEGLCAQLDRLAAALPPEHRALLSGVIDYNESRIAVLETRIAELQWQLPKTPQNSSLPPARSIRMPSRRLRSGVTAIHP